MLMVCFVLTSDDLRRLTACHFIRCHRRGSNFSGKLYKAGTFFNHRRPSQVKERPKSLLANKGSYSVARFYTLTVKGSTPQHRCLTRCGREKRKANVPSSPSLNNYLSHFLTEGESVQINSSYPSLFDFTSEKKTSRLIRAYLGTGRWAFFS